MQAVLRLAVLLCGCSCVGRALLVGVEKKMKLGQSNLESVPLGLGTWSWGNKLIWGYDESQDTEIAGAWQAAVDAGLTFFDTGDSYGTGALEGRAEELLGFSRAGASWSSKKGLVYGTKLAVYPWRLSRASFVEALRASLRRLRLDRVEVAQAHWSPANYAPWQQTALLDGLADCHDAGLADAVGLSNFGPEALRRAVRRFEARGVPVALNQVQFSLLSIQPAKTGLLDACRELGVTPVAYSPLALGALVGTRGTTAPRRFVVDQVEAGSLELRALLADLAAARGKTAAQVALNWGICKGTLPIVGARTAKRVRENAGALGWRLTPDQVNALDDAAARTTKKATQNIFMTS